MRLWSIAGSLPLRLGACSLALMLGSSGCTLGNDDNIDSPYASASIELSATTGVADGFTSVALTVTGQPGTELTLIATGAGASFVVPDPGSIQEKTVYLRDEGGVGTASAQVVSTQAQVVSVALKVERIRSAREIEFQPVRMAAGTPQAVRMQPGQVVHDVCVAVSSSRGAVQAESISVAGSFGPMRVEVHAQAPAGLACPSEPADGFGWRGYAAFTWATAVEFAEVTLSYQGPGDADLASSVLPLHGQAFPGYQVTAAEPTTTASWTAIELEVAYPAVGALSGGPAAGVTLGDIRFIPEGGPVFLGSSSGAAGDEPITDAGGGVTLFFDTANATSGTTFALFLTPQNGATVYLTDIAVP